MVWEILIGIGFFILMALFWGSNLFAIPGNWLMLAGGILLAVLTPGDWRIDIGWGWLVAVLLLCIVGEIVEFITGALGASQAGGSRRSAIFALIGSIIGAVVGLFIGLPIPIPVVGSIIGALFFTCLGALIGGYLGERSIGESNEKGMRVGVAAFWGRLLGAVGKLGIGAVILVLLTVAIVL